MGIDRFVKWNKAERPTLDIIKMTLEDYLGGAQREEAEVDGNRITVMLAGKPSYPFRRHSSFEKHAPGAEQHPDRWFEVVVEKDHIDVITRQTDEFTNVVAEGFARLCQRCWNGKRV